MRAPRVLFFIPGLNVGGAERHMVDLRVRLDRLGFDTHLLVYGPRRSAAILEHPGARDPVLLDLRGMSDPLGWLRVRAELRRTAPDVIVAINQTPLVVATVTRLLGGTSARIACIFHSTLLRRNEARRVFLFRLACRLAEALVFVSANQKRYWVGRGLACRAMPVILNGVDFARFEHGDRGAMRAPLGFAADDTVAGLVAAFRPEKDHAIFLQALALLHRKGRPVKGLLVGDGPTRAQCERLADDLGLRDHVVFAGEQADVRAYMAACDVGVLCSSLVETFSLSAIEYLAMGVPMVMSRVGGATEIVSDGVNGFLFDPGKVGDFADKLERACEPDMRARLAGAARASIAHLSIEDMVAHYADLLGTLAGEGRTRR